MKKVYKLGLGIVAAVGIYYFLLSPDGWSTTYSKDKFTGKESVELIGRVPSLNGEALRFSCENKKIFMEYVKNHSEQSETNEDFGDLYVKVDNHRQIKFDDAAWINYGKFSALQINSTYDGQKMRELLIELQGVDAGIDIGFRGRKLSYDARLGNSGLSDALIEFLGKCHIRLDQWPEPAAN